MPTINTWISDDDYNKYLVVKQKEKGAWTEFIHNALNGVTVVGADVEDWQATRVLGGVEIRPNKLKPIKTPKRPPGQILPDPDDPRVIELNKITDKLIKPPSEATVFMTVKDAWEDVDVKKYGPVVELKEGETWKLKSKPEFKDSVTDEDIGRISREMNKATNPEHITPIIKTPKDAEKAVAVGQVWDTKGKVGKPRLYKPSELCKIHGTPLDGRGRCLVKGCKFG